MTVDLKTTRGTPITWSDTAGDLVMTLNDLDAGTARIGAQKDLGAGATDEQFEWRLTVQFETAPVVGETVDVYVSTTNGTEEDGQEGEADADLGSANSLKNMSYVGSLVVTSTDADHDMTASGVARILTRYFSPVVYNNTADNLQATNDTCEITFTPIVPQSANEV
jgi:hypothetical protein